MATKTARPKRRPKVQSKPAPKTNQINVRISDPQKDLLARAAEKVGVSMSSFLLSAGLERAREVTGEA